MRIRRNVDLQIKVNGLNNISQLPKARNSPIMALNIQSGAPHPFAYFSINEAILKVGSMIFEMYHLFEYVTD